ncbi:uncharacterized protein RAG0_16262 [Rhynchosporium agropyri]|uniref:Uncharacterized protein n=1 Tax=Rhynchosporium agropyri TaxID=914238 RepID=A0A1E1LPP0_9HELO|nr:uncharacterized protein RAG0_16262 [Rhynchosporium agropyri]
MRSQSVLSIALVAFTSTLHAAPIQMTDGVKAAMGTTGDEVHILNSRTNLVSRIAASLSRSLKSEAAALQAQSDAVHADTAEGLSAAEQQALEDAQEEAAITDNTKQAAITDNTKRDSLDKLTPEELAAYEDAQEEAAISDNTKRGNFDLTADEAAAIDAEEFEKKRALSKQEQQEIDAETAEEDAFKRDLEATAAKLQAQSDAVHADTASDLTAEEKSEIDSEDAYKRDLQAQAASLQAQIDAAKAGSAESLTSLTPAEQADIDAHDAEKRDYKSTSAKLSAQEESEIDAEEYE